LWHHIETNHTPETQQHSPQNVFQSSETQTFSLENLQLEHHLKIQQEWLYRGHVMEKKTCLALSKEEFDP